MVTVKIIANSFLYFSFCIIFILVNQELSFEDMLELVNSSYFSNDDVTRLTDALLNRQAEENNAGDYNWHKVN